MKLSELFAELGDDHLRFQSLNDNITKVNQRKVGTEVSFMTEEPLNGIVALFPGQKSQRVALVVWVDAERWDATVVRLKEEGKL